MFDSRKRGFKSQVHYNDLLTQTFGIHSSLTGIPSYRAVFLNTEAKDTNGETVTDNTTVGFAATADATAVAVGIVKDGCSDGYSDLTLLPQTNQDFNVAVTTIGTMALEVAPGEVIAQGAVINVDAEGRGAALGDATTFIALTAATGAGTASNPEFIIALIR